MDHVLHMAQSPQPTAAGPPTWLVACNCGWHSSWHIDLQALLDAYAAHIDKAQHYT